MNNLSRVLSFDDVIELCGSVATSRGGVFKASKAVGELDWDADKNQLFATVKGSQPDPYQQRITIEAHRIDAECSCPVGINCKHVAAALLAWIDQQDLTPSAEDQALRRVNRWLQQMVNDGRKLNPVMEHHEPGEPLLFYQLQSTSLTQHKTGVALEILQSRLLKRGGFGKEAPYRYHSHFQHPDWVQSSDHAILELAVGRHNDFNYRTLTVAGDIGHLLMVKLVDTGRCFWGEERATALSRGNPRTLEFIWEPKGESNTALEVNLPDVNEWALIPSDPPWYIDIDAMQAGPLENVPKVSMLAHLVDAPPIPMAHTQAVSNYLASRLPEAKIPLPVEPDFERINVPPQPVLVLQSREQSQDIREYFASIHFRYSDYLLPFDGTNTEDTLEGKTSDGKPLILERDLKGESAAVVQFAEHFTDFDIAVDSTSDFFSKADRKPRVKDVQGIASCWRELLNRQTELEALGWEVQCREPFDLSFKEISTIDASVDETVSNWFDMALKLTYGDETFDLVPLVIDWLESDDRDQPILLQSESGQWLEVSTDVVAPVADILMELFDDPKAQDGLRLPRQRAEALESMDEIWQEHGLSVSWQGAEGIFNLAERLRNFEKIETPELPASFNATLRPYQLDGVAWLGFLAEYSFNGILADDMGLGKTPQTLAHLLIERDSGRLSQPALVVAPTSLLGNWKKEAARFTPTLKTHIWHGPDRKSLGLNFEDYDIVITSYALVTRDIDYLCKQEFGCIVLDEAQAIKNPTAKVSQALKSMSVKRRLCLTGTPMENHLGELWSLYDFLMPNVLGSKKHFTRYFRTPIETHGSLERQERLSQMIKPFLLRRNKEQVAQDLPPKTEIIRDVPLDGEQARLYESIRISMEHRVRSLLSERGLERSHIEMLDALLKLRQTCCHPSLVKLDNAKGIVESAKTRLLMSMLEELIAEGRKILLFSQFTEMLSLIETELNQEEIPYVKLTGRTRKRDEVIDQFQSGDIPLFLISLKAGGTGLNLTAADTVIHYDPWWNPAVENQASDRAHRIGQTKPVFIYKLVASNTVEEKIMAMQRHKQMLADQTVNNAQSDPMQNLTADDFLSLFAGDDPVQSVA